MRNSSHDNCHATVIYLATVAVLASLVMSFCLSAQAALSTSARLVFVGAHGAHGMVILSIHADGSNIRRLTPVMYTSGSSTTNTAMSPAPVLVAPDGNHYAFVSSKGITIRPTSGGKGVVIVRGVAKLIAWSPDNKWILFIKPSLFGPMFVVRPDGSHLHSIKGKPILPFVSIQWSHDSRSIFVANARVTEFNLTGSEQRPVPGTEGVTALAFSPNGRHVVMQRYSSTRSGIEVANADFSHAKWITSLNQPDARFASWSLDGTKVAFVNPVAPTGAARAEIEIVGVAGQKLGALHDTAAAGQVDNYLQWSPDGYHIAFERAINPTQGTLSIGDIRTGIVKTVYGAVWMGLAASWIRA